MSNYLLAVSKYLLPDSSYLLSHWETLSTSSLQRGSWKDLDENSVLDMQIPDVQTVWKSAPGEKSPGPSHISKGSTHPSWWRLVGCYYPLFVKRICNLSLNMMISRHDGEGGKKSRAFLSNTAAPTIFLFPQNSVGGYAEDETTVDQHRRPQYIVLNRNNL